MNATLAVTYLVYRPVINNSFSGRKTTVTKRLLSNLLREFRAYRMGLKFYSFEISVIIAGKYAVIRCVGENTCFNKTGKGRSVHFAGAISETVVTLP